MQVKILSEAGYNEALFGLGLSHGVTSGMKYNANNFAGETRPFIYDSEKIHRMEEVAQRLVGKGNGHDKFLRQICVWLDITAPRYWWPEMDQYKVATVTQSESTMHTITKHEFTQDMFENTVSPAHLAYIEAVRLAYLDFKEHTAWRELISNLPQSYLQRRILTCNYATLRNIIAQRTGHRLSEWAVFIDAIKTQCQHPELLP